MNNSITNESRCMVRNVTHNIEKMGEILTYEPKQMLVVKMSESSILELKYSESAKMYQGTVGANVFVSVGPDWRVE